MLHINVVIPNHVIDAAAFAAQAADLSHQRQHLTDEVRKTRVEHLDRIAV
jgi:hypothetical protein